MAPVCDDPDPAILQADCASLLVCFAKDASMASLQILSKAFIGDALSRAAAATTKAVMYCVAQGEIKDETGPAEM
jgi:hypothetical protein